MASAWVYSGIPAGTLEQHTVDTVEERMSAMLLQMPFRTTPIEPGTLDVRARYGAGLTYVGLAAESDEEAEVAVQRGGTSKRRKRKYPRRWSDPLVPVQPGIILAETPEVQPEIITVPARPFLSEALQEREARKKRMRKVAAIAAAFLDS
jgi:hypothetical protein